VPTEVPPYFWTMSAIENFSLRSKLLIGKLEDLKNRG